MPPIDDTRIHSLQATVIRLYPRLRTFCSGWPLVTPVGLRAAAGLTRVSAMVIIIFDGDDFAEEKE